MTASWRTWSAAGAAAVVVLAPVAALLAGDGGGSAGGAVPDELVRVLAAALLPACYLGFTGARLPAPSRPWFVMTLLSKALSVAMVTALLVVVAEVGPFAVLGVVVLVPAGIGALGTLLLRQGQRWGMLPSLASALACAVVGLWFTGDVADRLLVGWLCWLLLLGSAMLLAAAVRERWPQGWPQPRPATSATSASTAATAATATVPAAPATAAQAPAAAGAPTAAEPKPWQRAEPKPWQRAEPEPWQRPARGGWRTGCATAAIVVTVLLGLLGVWVCVSLYRFDHPPMPDVNGIASSAAVVQADARTTEATDSAVDRLRAAVPSLSGVGTLVDDSCETDDMIGAIGAQPHYKPVTCQRSVVWVGAFDGDPKKEQKLIADALAHEGWRTSSGQTGYLTANQPAPKQTLPTDRTSAGLFLRAQLSARPNVPDVSLPNVPVDADGSMTAPVASAKSGVVFREARLPSLPGLAGIAFRSHQQVITVEISDTYFVQQPAPTPTTPFTPAYGGHPCYSGSGDCN